MSLNLDTRQRAMLDEMGVKVWWPDAALAVTPAPVSTASATPRAASSALGNAPEFVASTPQLASLNPVFESPILARTGSAAPVNLPRSAALAAGAASRPDTGHLNWPALQQAVASCQACGLCATRKNTVFGVGQLPSMPDGAPQVDWLIVGEAPGENEDLQGEPFVGAAGKLLDNMLKAMGCSRRENVYIANVLKCRPPANRNPAPEEIAQCAPYLHRQVALLQPKIILAMGRFAVQTVLADSVPDVHTTPLGKLRGKVYAYHGVPVVVTYHPAYLLRSLADKAKAWADLCLAMATARRNAPP